MFEENILTFNPGWDESVQNLDSLTDIRAIQRRLKERGIELLSEADESCEGPTSLSIEDPDGNTILLNQRR